MEVTMEFLSFLATPLVILTSIFTGGFVGCQRRAGGFWVALFTIAGILVVPVVIGADEEAIPKWTEILYLVLWFIFVLGGLFRTLFRKALQGSPSDIPSSRDRAYAGLSSVLGSILGASLAGLALSTIKEINATEKQVHLRYDACPENPPTDALLTCDVSCP